MVHYAFPVDLAQIEIAFEQHWSDEHVESSVRLESILRHLANTALHSSNTTWALGEFGGWSVNEAREVINTHIWAVEEKQFASFVWLSSFLNPEMESGLGDLSALRGGPGTDRHEVRLSVDALVGLPYAKYAHESKGNMGGSENDLLLSKVLSIAKPISVGAHIGWLPMRHIETLVKSAQGFELDAIGECALRMLGHKSDFLVLVSG